eukprot:CAMPEP_0116020650 /NCGR_PEP_ID=MMETSP0321-20121206/9922_1 /TAXON_ID=163516 /ORGANISM="Leptocylindrus danicus var. danicus, Strain B650" /LENGTH=147 /DNA_ID=CAMNT_0003491379 /DNA_START=647 /DNA_END=1090 /DNA_ORIENTATION=+
MMGERRQMDEVDDSVIHRNAMLDGDFSRNSLMARARNMGYKSSMNSKSPTRPLKCPPPTSSSSIHNDIDTEDMERMYDLSTWNMYRMIIKYRMARSCQVQEEREASTPKMVDCGSSDQIAIDRTPSVIPAEEDEEESEEEDIFEFDD